MAVRVADAAMAAKKFAQRGAAASQDYAAGVTGSGASWQSNTAGAADTYAAAVQEAIGRGAFARGVQAAGGSKYEERARTVGAQRFGPGVTAAAPEWERQTAPYLQTIASLTLPPRRPKGDPSNLARVSAVTEALRARKVGR
jgi:hypothetical protein